MTDPRFLRTWPSRSGRTTRHQLPPGWQLPVIVHDSLGDSEHLETAEPPALRTRIAAGAAALKTARNGSRRAETSERDRNEQTR